MNPLVVKSLEESYLSTKEDIQYQYNPFSLDKIQNYNPVYSEFFVMNEKNAHQIAFNNKYHIKDLSTVVEVESKKEIEKSVFIKYSPLLDPLRFMIGKYDLSDAKTTQLPNLKTQSIEKLSLFHNSSYVDNFFCYLNSQMLHHHNVVNCLDYFGSSLAIQKKYKMNIADDLEYVSSSSFFKENLGKLFLVNHEKQNDYTNFGSRSNKLKLNISSKIENLEVISLSEELSEVEIDVSVTNSESELVYEIDKKHNISVSSNSNASNNSELNYSSCDEDDDDDEDEDDDKDDEDLWESESDSSNYESVEEDEYISAYINNFPVQLICLEKCDGTLDELFMKNFVTEETGSAIFMQIIMTLVLFQKCFRFTHNDLHTNNIMYMNTDVEFLYYKFENRVYKVPTYGKIFKIIDFGRAIYRLNSITFCSDSFAPGGDAATQYNCEPFLNEKKPRLEPNFSFDLCRLGTSVYDFIIDQENGESEKFDELQKTIQRWCTDDNGKNVLYKKTGEDRYPNFKLYKMISRTVHEHTPENQLKFSYFNKYAVEVNHGTVDVMDIDAIPLYA